MEPHMIAMLPEYFTLFFFYQLYLMILRSLNGFIQLAYHCKIVCRLNADTFELHTSEFNQLINKQNLF